MKKEKALHYLCLGLTGALVALCGFGPKGENAAQTKPPSGAGLTPDKIAAYSKIFTQQIWPLLKKDCAPCHMGSNPSQLRLMPDAAATYQLLLTDGHLDPNNPSSLLARVSSTSDTTRMPPPPRHAWSAANIAKLRDFCQKLYAGGPKDTESTDGDGSHFPPALLMPYHGPIPADSGDNTFLTYYQLRNKIQTIFGDDWRRDNQDMFEKNIAQFSGADFVHSFNESAHPSAEYLAAMDALSEDVASNAYLNHTGPFVRMRIPARSPLTSPKPDPLYQHDITLLYQRMLFRPPTPMELQQSYDFLRAIYRAAPQVAQSSYALQFQLTAKDPEGHTATRQVRIEVVNDSYGLQQTLVNENDTSHTSSDKKLAKWTLGAPVLLKAGDNGQFVTISNEGHQGVVEVSGLEVTGPLPNETTHLISMKDAGVVAQGAWHLTERDGIASYEEDDRDGGEGQITIPLKVAQTGKYILTLDWRYHPVQTTQIDGRTVYEGRNATETLVEIHSHSPSTSAQPPLPPLPPQGQVTFYVDETDDTHSTFSPDVAFQFGKGDGVEISNAGTQGLVAADAVHFVPDVAKGSQPPLADFYVKSNEADGQQGWGTLGEEYGQFYQAISPHILSDGNNESLKGKLRLYYRPDVHAKEWQPTAFYRIEFGYPGHEGHSSHVPLTVHALASTPILTIVAPPRAHVGAMITLDASASFNLQRSPLEYTWRQIGGARVAIKDVHTAVLRFTVPPMSAQQAAWEGLCRLLMKHPDFLFTRPLSLAVTTNPKIRRRLQLVKIAQDLVARPPTQAEIAQLDAGAPLSSFVNHYLHSKEFADFYFRRIRLYLESHGSLTDDEPVRLWTWIALHHHPFKEILTADYTVTPDWKVEPRPAYYGHSGVLTMKGFIEGKPGLPHFNYSAQVLEKFLGYVFIVPEAIVKMREGITAVQTTTPGTVCFTCHQVLTPLAYQRSRFTDDGVYHERDSQGNLIDDTDHQLVPSYPFKGEGMQAFAEKAVNTERFIRTMIQTHFVFYFGREMRWDKDERGLYHRLWETEKANHYDIEGLIRAIVLSPEYLNGSVRPSPASSPEEPTRERTSPRVARLGS
ncbi:MAG TPA: hypothetical protein VKV29_06940 [Chthonomonas sp.]|uniref:hypothetical protein n=1 Tax=Chthonomonas sp. TaxID=2282153 RepID=UPI002B4B8A5E|nr:hypothetical protein [Chthonomonas sp.]HLH80003.1 hypothetical protein [Chthonomonas sp.]